MRIRTQFRITLAVFTLMLVIIAASIILSSQQVGKMRVQESLANNIVQGASDLSYLTNDYVISPGTQQLTQWQARYASFSQDISNLSVDSIKQQRLADEITSHQQRMKEVFNDIVSIVEIQSQNQSANPSETLSLIQVSWSRMSIQSIELITDATSLAQLLRNQVDQLNMLNFALILAIIGTFSTFLAVIYVQTFRRTLKSISDLQMGAAVIGSGNLDFKFKEGKKDEIGEVSRAFNKMTADLKTVTASKADLEKEIEERKIAEEALAKSEQHWSTTLSSIGDAVIATDVAGNITFMNNIAENLTGWTLSEASQKPLQEVFPIINEETGRKVQNPVEKVLEKGTVVGLANHSILLRRDGLEVPIDDSGSPIKDQHGQVTGVVLVFHDITERKKTEQELNQYRMHLEKLVEERTNQLKDSERLAAIGATAGMVGHDIRNPLQAITSDVYLAKMDLASCTDCEEKENVQESLEEIERNVGYINKIVSDLQDYAKPLTPIAKETNLENVCQEVLLKSGMPRNIKASCQVDDNAKVIIADPELLRRIISNLVTNAIQAMPDGGKLTISAYQERSNILVEVKDTGVGIPEEARAKLFMPLFTTKSKGQGFGLAVVKRVTEAMNGTISFESQEGKGTTFTIRLPPKSKLGLHNKKRVKRK